MGIIPIIVWLFQSVVIAAIAWTVNHFVNNGTVDVVVWIIAIAWILMSLAIAITNAKIFSEASRRTNW